MIYLKDTDPSKVKRYIDKRAAKRFMEKQKKEIEELRLKLDFAERRLPDLEESNKNYIHRHKIMVRLCVFTYMLLAISLLLMHYGY